ncbi:hypothetical protein RQP46_006411 [Phenoliferia psychrophenolica]
MQGLELTTISELVQDCLASGFQAGSAIPLTEGFVSLTQLETKDSTCTIALYSALFALISPLLEPSATQADVQLVADYLSDSLFPALARATGTSDSDYTTLAVRATADILIDVLWQVDQDIDNGAVHYRERTSQVASTSAVTVEDAAMDVDQPTADGTVAPVLDDAATKAADDKRKAEAHKARLEVQKAARKRIADFVNLLMASRALPTQACRERLESTFLALVPLALITDQAFFNRLEVRARTALYYKQQKFNLLREESEGYAKLIVELLSNMGPPHSTTTARSQESEEQRMQRAQNVSDSIKNLIGNFDLDPDRTLDIVLDTFSDQLVDHHQFFLDYLSVSPWSDSKTKDSPAAGERESKGKGKAPVVDVGLGKDRGSYLISQVLGFKFKYYQKAGAEEVPETLYLMTALLIWNDLIKFSDIWPHLSPDDAELAKVDGRYRDEQEQLARSCGGSNALAMAGALVDDDAPRRAPVATAAAAAAAARALPNQKAGLLRALLSIGDVQHAFLILAQYPTLAAANPDICDLLLRLLNVAVAPAYDLIALARVTKGQYLPECNAPRQKFVAPSSSGTKPVKAAPATTHLTGRALGDPNKDELFFFAEWNDRVHKCEDFDQVLSTLETYLPILNVFISRDFPLYTRVCRIIKHDLESSRAPRWQDIIRTHLLPAVSLLDSHAVAALEIWNVLELLTIEKRFTFYGEWKDQLYRKIPALSVRKAEAEREVKGILRRLSTENVKKLGKTLGKAAHTNPVVIFSVALNQVSSYDNLIAPVVEASRYLTPFGFDVLVFSILDALSADRPKTKEDGTSTSLWLVSLADFTGQLYRRWKDLAYSIPTVLKYLVHQLSAGSPKDLAVLHELIRRMAGVEPFADLSDPQVMSLAGGKRMRNEVFNMTDLSQLGKDRQIAAVGVSRTRLSDAVRRSGLANALLISIAVQRQACITSTIAHLKSLGNLYDETHKILFQYMEFLAITLGSTDAFVEELPSVAHLMAHYGLEAGVAFDIARPKLRLMMKVVDDEADSLKRAKLQDRVAAAKAESSSQPTTPGPAPSEGSAPPVDASVGTGAATDADAVMSDAAPAETSAPAAAVDAPPPVPAARAVVAASPKWHPCLRDVISDMRAILPESALETIGAPFYVTYWSLTLADLHTPTDRYAAEVERLSQVRITAAELTTPGSPADKERFRESVKELCNHLLDEQKAQAIVRGKAFRRLFSEKPFWFPQATDKVSRYDVVYDLLQHCILPRAKLSLPDAVFANMFVRRMHAINTPGFQLVIFYDKLFADGQLGPILYQMSENEARNFARFLFDVFSDLNTWFNSEALYAKDAIGVSDKEPAGLLGFRRFATPKAGGDEGPVEYYIHATFKDLVKKWYGRVAQTIADNFASGEYMHIKNSILVMTKVADKFPLHYPAGQLLYAAVETLIRTETREDLRILAQGYKAVLGKRRKQWLDQPPRAPDDASSTAFARRSAAWRGASGALSPGARVQRACPSQWTQVRPSRQARSAWVDDHERTHGEANDFVRPSPHPSPSSPDI